MNIGVACNEHEHSMPLPIFLVEDNVLIQNNLTAALEELSGAQVVGSAKSEPAAIAWLISHRGDWSLAVVDLFLEEGSGLGVVKWCRERSANQRVVVLTNYANGDVAQQAALLGADAVFDKSIGLDAFFDFCTSYRVELKL
jgi:ActR/RegA family two-component response regulator